MVDELFELCAGLSDVVTPTDARITGSWERIAEPGTDVVSFRYAGHVESSTPLVGILVIDAPDSKVWNKTAAPQPGWRDPAGMRLEVSVVGWLPERPHASIQTWLDGVQQRVYVEGIAEPPHGCVVQDGDVRTGEPHVLYRVRDLTCVVLLLCNSDVRSSVDGTWRLHESLASKLPPPLARWLTHRSRGRSLPTR